VQSRHRWRQKIVGYSPPTDVRTLLFWNAVQFLYRVQFVSPALHVLIVVKRSRTCFILPLSNRGTKAGFSRTFLSRAMQSPNLINSPSACSELPFVIRWALWCKASPRLAQDPADEPTWFRKADNLRQSQFNWPGTDLVAFQGTSWWGGCICGIDYRQGKRDIHYYWVKCLSFFCFFLVGLVGFNRNKWSVLI